MFTTNTQSRLHSAALIDKEQYEQTQRAGTAPATFFNPPSSRGYSARDPVTAGFLGSDLLSKLFGRPSHDTGAGRRRRDSGDRSLSQSRVQSRTSRMGSFSLSPDVRLVSLLDREQVSASRSGRTRSYSLVSSLDTTQTRESSSYRERPRRSEKPPELGELNTLQQAIPVARAAARFRSALSEEREEGGERGRARRRKSHSLY